MLIQTIKIAAVLFGRRATFISWWPVWIFPAANDNAAP
jgi:hypothetical protein